MPRRKAPPGCYWRGNTLWGRLTVKGREVRFSLRTDDAEVAKGRRKAERDRQIAASHFGDQRRTWKDTFVIWGEHIAGNVGPSTVERYAVSLAQLEPWLAGLYLDEIDRGVVSEIVRGRRQRGASNATIRRDLTALSSVLGFAEAEDWRQDNPALVALGRLTERRDPIVLPEPDHIRRVIARAPGLFAGLIEAARLTGCRQEELAALERRRIDRARRQATVIGKGNKLRVINLYDAAELFGTLPVHLGSQFVFWHGNGRPYRNIASRFRVMVKAAQKAAQAEGADFRPFRFHDLRHLFAVEYLKSGRGSLYDLQQHLGHTSVKTTEIYLHYLTAEEKRAAMYATAQNPAQVQRFDDAKEADNVG